jgi:hypothetical protein
MAELRDAGANPIGDGLRTILRRDLSAFGETDVLTDLTDPLLTARLQPRHGNGGSMILGWFHPDERKFLIYIKVLHALQNLDCSP